MPAKRNLSAVLIYFIYDLLITFIYCFAVIKWSVKKGLTRDPWVHKRAERYGIINFSGRRVDYWFHCVSVGEVVAASCVIKVLLADHADTKILVTTTTPTGAQRLHDIFAGQVVHHYLPYDLPWLMHSFIKTIRPKRCLVTEVELWPNMIRQCAKADIPVLILNARMTERSAQRYQKLSALFTPMLANISHVMAQGERDHQAYRYLGMPEEKLTLTHNIKFDQLSNINVPEKVQQFAQQVSERFVLIAGSTHDQEERHWLDVQAGLGIDESLLCIVPRHPERFAVVASLLDEQDIPYITWTQWQATPELLTAQIEVVLVDAMGVLTPLYSCADVAFVGGSINNRGGHNALEPAYFGVPVIMGPHQHNNPVICAKLAEVEALHTTHNVEQSVALVDTWYAQPELKQTHGQAGQRVLSTNQGALARSLEVIAQYLEPDTTSPD